MMCDCMDFLLNRHIVTAVELVNGTLRLLSDPEDVPLEATGRFEEIIEELRARLVGQTRGYAKTYLLVLRSNREC